MDDEVIQVETPKGCQFCNINSDPAKPMAKMHCSRCYRTTCEKCYKGLRCGKVSPNGEYYCHPRPQGDGVR